MKPELKKLIVFGMIITFFTSTYATFLNTIMNQGFLTGNFVSNWLRTIPRTYFLLLPFVLITGRITSALVDRMFRKEARAK